MAKRSGTEIRTKIYNKFKGVDFTSDPSLVDDARSPMAVNMVADEGGMPEKRVGYRTIKSCNDSINGLYTAEFSNVKHYLVHTGTKLYRWYEDGTADVELSTAFPDLKSIAVYMNNKLWIFTGNGLFVYDGSTCTRADANPYIPKTIIARTPSGGGTTYEGINYLTGKQEIRVKGDGTSTEYKLPYSSVDSVDKVVVNDTEMTTGWTYVAGEDHIDFDTAPSAPSVSGQDNVFITFTHNTNGYADMINKCTIATVWGIGGTSDRIVCSGNGTHQNQDYICGFNDGTYWPDTLYATVGTAETAIMGYRRINEQLAVIKEDNGQDSTVFLRTGELEDDGDPLFTIKSAIGGAGAVSKYAFGNIGNEQMFLTGNGVYAITTNSLTAEKMVQNRSKRVDPKLVKENLSDAMVALYKDKFMIFVDDKVYGLDGTIDKAYANKNNMDFMYECFYWEDIPATAVMKVADSGEENLYFGTDDGRVCKFNYDVESMTRYADSWPVSCTPTATMTEDEYVLVKTADGWTLEGDVIALSDYGVTEPSGAIVSDQIILTETTDSYKAEYYRAIISSLATKSDDDGDPMVYKTLLKKGNAVIIKPYARSSAKVLIRTDKDSAGWEASSGTMDVLDWEDIDFARFTFSSNDAPSEIPINRKVKNYKRLQIIVKNDVLNEGFGVFGIVKHYVTGNFAKR